MPASRKNKLWGSTKYGAHKIDIYINPRMYKKTDGITKSYKTGVKIHLNARLLLDPARLDNTLIHELIHVLEFLNSVEMFDMQEINHCSAFVQTISNGLAQMLRELRVVGVE